MRISRFALPALLLAAASLLPIGCSKESPTAPPAGRPNPDLITGQVAVTLAPGADPAAIATDYSATLIEWESDERQAAFNPPSGTTATAFAATLLADARVLTAEQNTWLETAESRQQSFAFDDGLGSSSTYAEQSVVRAIGLDAAHAVTIGTGSVVAVLDTGIDPNHPVFAGRIVAGHDFVDDDSDPSESTNGVDDDGDGRMDEAHGHGSHVAGLVVLVAPGASIMPIRVLDADGRGDVVQVAAAIRWAIAHGAHVINLSLGTLGDSQAIDDALEEAGHAGVFLVASAGNWGSEEPEEYPARASQAFAVAASDTAARPASFTSFAHHVRISAPGVALRSAYPGGVYRLWTGTSMSAPLASGAAALLFAHHPDWDDDQVGERLEQTTSPIVGANLVQRDKLGSGMLQVGAALTAPEARR